MKAGNIALLESNSDGIESQVTSQALPDNSAYDSIASSIQIMDDFTLSRGVTAYSGTAATEEVSRVAEPRINEDGTIAEGETARKETSVVDFLLVPDTFVAISKSSGEFLYPLLSQMTQHSAFPAEIDVDAFASDRTDAEYWKVGFTDRGDGADNGVLHGDSVLNDSEFGNIVGSSSKNQIGINFEFNAEILKLFMTESGYLEVYQPGSFEASDYIEFVLDEVIQYARMK